MKRSANIVSMILLMLTMACLNPLAVFAQSHPGFLVVAPDRGYLGNQETNKLFEKFQRSYPASLALVGNMSGDHGPAYTAYIKDAVEQLRSSNATSLVAIPLFLSEADPQLQSVRDIVRTSAADLKVDWAPTMAESYLIGQILLDRVEEISQSPQDERLVLVGMGAHDEKSEQAIKEDLTRLLKYIKRYRSFQSSEVVVYYAWNAEQRREKNKEVEAHITELAAKQGRTLIVPAFIGAKFTHMMAATNWMQRKFKKMNVAFQSAEVMPHSNLLVWLKKTANQHAKVEPSEIGVVIMPHGSSQPYNDAVEKIIAPLTQRYQIELAYGMGDAAIIQDAVSRLEQRGVKKIVFGRMYGLVETMKPKTDYILGLSDEYLDELKEGRTLPRQIRSAAIFSTFGGYEEKANVAQVLHERIMEISQNPSEETVVLLAHGTGSDESNERWVSVMNANIQKLRQEPHCAKLKALKAMTVREDWPKLREKAVKEVREYIEESSKNGRVLVVSNRLYGSGQYSKMLDGLDFEMNGEGFLSPIITDWLDQSIQQVTEQLKGPVRLAEQR